MARIRTIKPSFFLNEDLAELGSMDRLIFIGLWTQSDREGRLEDRPKRLKAALIPYDDYDMDQALDRLADSGFISRYSSSCNNIIQINNFSKHQRPRNDEDESVLPPLRDDGDETSSLDSDDSVTAQCLGKEGSTGKERSSEVALRGLFCRFWAAYPRKVAKDKALKAWMKLGPDEGTLESMLAAIEWQRTTPQWTKDVGEFIPHPTTWLNQRRWEDEPTRSVNGHVPSAKPEDRFAETAAVLARIRSKEAPDAQSSGGEAA